MVALLAMAVRWVLSRSLVIDRNTGIVPRGLARVKNDVRQMKAKGRLSMVMSDLRTRKDTSLFSLNKFSHHRKYTICVQ